MSHKFFENYYQLHQNKIDEITDGYIGMLPKDIKNEIKKYVYETFIYDGRYPEFSYLNRWKEIIEMTAVEEIIVRINWKIYKVMKHVKHGDVLLVFLSDKITLIINENSIGHIGLESVSCNEKYEVQLYFNYDVRKMSNRIMHTITKGVDMIDDNWTLINTVMPWTGFYLFSAAIGYCLGYGLGRLLSKK